MLGIKIVCTNPVNITVFKCEITLDCDCPDGAVCCKHVAAVLYGIGARLDTEPELFFTLRGVDPQSIISSEAVVDTLTADASSELDSSDLGDVFGISLDRVKMLAKR